MELRRDETAAAEFVVVLGADLGVGGATDRRFGTAGVVHFGFLLGFSSATESFPPAPPLATTAGGGVSVNDDTEG